MTCCESEARDRTVLFVATPALWPAWPFLAVVRRAAAGPELGVVFDAQRSTRRRVLTQAGNGASPPPQLVRLPKHRSMASRPTSSASMNRGCG
jgi:hypothetical protein